MASSEIPSIVTYLDNSESKHIRDKSTEPAEVSNNDEIFTIMSLAEIDETTDGMRSPGQKHNKTRDS